jgi:predicted enzyme related to lactoylglutathione lyase
MRYAHTNLVARDWRTLAAFYETVFDCRPKPPVRKFSGDWLAHGTGVRDAELEGVHLALPGHGDGGPTLEIFTYGSTQAREPTSPDTRGLAHLAFEVEDVRATLAEVLAHGGSVLGEVTEREIDGVGELTFVYVRDPEGNLLELLSWA